MHALYKEKSIIQIYPNIRELIQKNQMIKNTSIWEIYQANTKQQGFNQRFKSIKQAKKGHFKTMKGKIYNKDITVRRHDIPINIKKYDKNVLQDME